MRIRFLTRFILLLLGFALTTLGVLRWQSIGFSLDALWPIAEEMAPHPVHALVLGLALIPPTLWEIFLLESRTQTGPDAEIADE